MNEVIELTKILLDNYRNVTLKNQKKDTVQVGVSNRHIHLSKEDLEKLFGENYQLTSIKDLSQPGQFAAKECVTLVGPKGVIEKVRVLGPVRKETQVEIFLSDSFKLGVKPIIKLSGDLKDTPGITLVGPKGVATIEKGVMVAQRHIHMSVQEAREYGLKNGDIVSLKTRGLRSGVLDNVIVRSDDKSKLDCHIDMEEANALGLKNNDLVEIIK